jgi:homospermidine synthase
MKKKKYKRCVMYVEVLGKETDCDLVHTWISPQGDKWGTYEYFNPTYNVSECFSVIIEKNTENQEPQKITTPKKSENVLDEW